MLLPPFFIEKFCADGAKSFCSYGLEKTSMDSHDAAAACYELTMLKICTSLLAGISLNNNNYQAQMLDTFLCRASLSLCMDVLY